MKINEHCTGCFACINSCPFNAISVKKDNDFFRAIIDEKKCKNCGLCKKICPSNKNNIINKSKIYVCRMKNNMEIKKSTSGGIFYTIGKYVLKNNGVVFGARFDSSFNVYHTKATTNFEMIPLLKSKYVKSNTSNVFPEVKKCLDDNLFVLFSGTPCQIAGLKSFLKKDYSN